MLGSSASKIFHPYRTSHNIFFYYIHQNYFKNVKYDILREVTMKITVFWEAASCSLLFCKYTSVHWIVLLDLKGNGSYQVTCHNSVTFYDMYYRETCSITHPPNIRILCHLTSLMTVQQPTRVKMRKNNPRDREPSQKQLWKCNIHSECICKIPHML